MRLHRSGILPILLSGAVACAVGYPSMSVQAKANAVPDALVHRVFSTESLPDVEGFAGQAPAVNPLPEGKGKALVVTNCTACHAANVWTSQRHTRDQWNAILDTMLSRGLSASDEDLETIGDYLATNFGPVQKDPPAPAPATPPAPPQLH